MAKHLHLEIIGKGRPFILLHGWGWNSSIWQPLIPQLAENFQLFLLDLPGFGKSPLITSNYQIEEIVSALLEITPAQAIWAGWSLGGMIAWYIALHYPQRVTNLITIASSPKFVCAENWPGIPAKTLEKFSQLLTQNYQKTLQEFLELQLRGSPKSAEWMETLQQKIITPSPHMITALLGGLKLLRELDLRWELTQMQCRSLHLFGSNDTLIPVSIAEKIQPLLPQGKSIVIKKSGHLLFLSQSEIFLQCVQEFLR